MEVVTTYLALGKAPLVEAVTGVPRQTIRIWKMQPWWKDLVTEIQTDSDQELDSKLTKIIDRSIDTINDRLEKGDFILDSKTGTIKRVPVKMRDAHKVSTDLIDKRNLLRGKPTSRVEKVSMEDLVKKLADQFAQFANRQNERIIEGEVVVDAISDQRETGLQEGTEVGEEDTPPTCETTGGAEQSPSDDGSLQTHEYNGGCGSQETPLEGWSNEDVESESPFPSQEQELPKK